MEDTLISSQKSSRRIQQYHIALWSRSPGQHASHMVAFSAALPP